MMGMEGWTRWGERKREETSWILLEKNRDGLPMLHLCFFLFFLVWVPTLLTPKNNAFTTFCTYL
jgi:hypothetical protein